MSDVSNSGSLPKTEELSKESRLAAVFGGQAASIGPRIAPPCDDGASEVSTSDIVTSQIEAENGKAIQYRTCSWQKTACLLFSEYICLAIMSFPWSYSVLGLVPGLIVTALVAAVVLYTSLVLWQFCLRHPEVRDVCDIGQMLFWGKEWAWWATAAMFILNNTFIQALHVLVGSKYLNTMVKGDHVGGCQTVVFSVIVTAICWVVSLPRTFSMMSKLGFWAAIFTFVSVMLATIFTAIQERPSNYNAMSGNPTVGVFPGASTTFVAGMAAFLNISYTFIGQITLPSFIAEMRDPRDFPKSLWACTMAEIIVFSVVGGVIYAFTGNEYITSPAFGSLNDLYKKISYSFMVPTIIFLGCLYSSVTGRFILFRTFRNSRHLTDHTVLGWAAWAGILLGTWILAFIISQIIPFFNSLLAVMSSVFDCWFGFIFWGVAYFRMRRANKEIGRHESPVKDALLVVLNAFIVLLGVFFLTVGTYASVQGIMDEFRAGTVSGVFSCANNAL
ncbi:hypothetical protein S40285_04453 [Stachybotrys chlorohalonatus IBT 40285]|uniref:Amino acid transporter transmembrane domain-containing protein n=1 Tax=Stachybotrys chlorohalonatus (strain IBT 40285) TaxID=1283841 RepID=A0A084QIR2_STAC4|nr:hypothetical protein S40285_04453 [Stachybotrys chlorohalonata IBT 40285]